jgi:hypothetical protein
VKTGPIGRHEPEHERISEKFLARASLLRLKFRFLKPEFPWGLVFAIGLFFTQAQHDAAQRVFLSAAWIEAASAGTSTSVLDADISQFPRFRDGLPDVVLNQANHILSVCC